MYGNTGLMRTPLIRTLFMVVAFLAMASSSLAMAVEQSAQPSSTQDSGTPKKKELSEFQKRSQERLRKIAVGQDFVKPSDGNAVTAQPFEATTTDAKGTSAPVSEVTKRNAEKADAVPAAPKVSETTADSNTPTQATSDPNGSSVLSTSASESGQSTVATVTEHVPTTLLMREVFDQNFFAFSSALGSPTLENVPAKWPTWEDVYFERESYRSRLEARVARDWKSVGSYWWQIGVTVSCENELTRGSPILFTLHYPSQRKNLVIEVVKETVRDFSAESQETLVRVKQGLYSTPEEGEGRDFLLLTVLFVSLGIVAIVLAFSLSGDLLTTIAKALFPDQWENPWTRRFLACCIGAAILIIIYLARLAI